MAVWVVPLSVAETVALPFAAIVPATAVKVAVVELAATVTEGGTLKDALLEDAATTVPPAGAALDTVTVQVVAAFEARMVILQVSEERLPGACRVMVAVAVVPFNVAVMVAVPLVEIVPAAATKVVVVELPGNTTSPGTVRAALLDARDTMVMLPRAGGDIVTVQVVVALDDRIEAPHVSEERLAGAWRLMLAVVVAPLSVAVIVALPFAEIVPAVAVNVAVVELAGIDTEAGTASIALLDERPTVVGPVSEAFESVTVQDVVALDKTVVGEHWRTERPTGACSDSVLIADVPLKDAVMIAL